MLGMGWFPDQANGVNRYFRSLLEAIESSHAVVVGPAADAPACVHVVERHERPPLRRMLGFARAVRTLAPHADVVDAHFAMYAFLPVLLGLRGKPLVVHFQGPWGNESSAGGAARLTARRWMERVVYRRAVAAIVLSEAFGELLVRRYGVRPEVVRVVRPGVNLEYFSPGDRGAARRALGLAPDRPVVVCARRLVARMGIDVLLESWTRVVSARGVRPLLLVVGDGAQRPALEAQARRLGLHRDVHFLGQVSDDDLLAAYRAAELTVAPSIAFEGFGLVTLEALACGTPVVGTAVGGLREALSALDPTLLVPPGDPDALAARLLGVLEGDAPAPSRARCREYAEGFTWQRTARDVTAIYQSAALAEAPGATAASVARRVQAD
jgi:glycosyltransferase involved in cell wall biosynthesis